MSDWRAYLEKAEAYHGHICSGQVLGIRMALLGLGLLGLRPGDNLRDLVLFLESDRSMLLIPQSPLHDAADKAKGCAFDFFLSRLKDKKVTVVGHFPHPEKLCTHCKLSILERNPRPGDLTDTAAEYILPEQDVVFITGTPFINKTITRLLELTRGAVICMVGPSTPMNPLLFEHGITSLSGLVVTDRAGVAEAIQIGCCEDIFSSGGIKVNLVREGA